MAVSQPSGGEDPEPHHPHPHHPHHPHQSQSPPENGSVTPEAPSPGLLLSRVDGCVLPFLGGFGRYHKQLVLLTWIPALFIGFSQHSDTVLLARPSTTCLMGSGDTAWDNLTTTTTRTLTTSTLTTTSTTSTHITTGHPVLTARAAAEQRNSSAHCACDNQSWAHELHSGLSENVVTKWNLVCESTWKVHIAKFSLLVGSIFGYLVLGVLADWFGRHAVLMVSVFFTLVFGMSVAFSINVTMFSTLRFFEGFWLAGIALSLYVLRIELCLPGWRFSMTMVANFVVLAAQLLMPGIAVLCYDWKILQAVIIGPLALMLTYIWIFPESLRWLLATKQYCRAKWLIERIAKKNNTNVDSHELITELNRVLEKPAQKTCIVKMVGTRNLWKNIVVLCVNSLTGYGIHHCFARSMMGEDNDHPTMFNNFYADYYTMAGIAVATGLALCPAVGIMGRRGGLLMFMIITALASLLDLGLLNLMVKYRDRFNMEPKTRSNFQVAFSIIGMFSSQAVSHLSIFFCAEITPTVIRGGGLGLVLASAGFGMLTAPIMELHNQKGYFLHHVIFACCTLICIICILLLPESRHQALPESLSEGEGYTRHPLLPPHKKPAEQRHLLPGPHGRSRGNDENANDRANDHSNVRDTPLREVAVSTVESTASSTLALEDDPGDELNAVRLKVLRQTDHSVPSATNSLPDLVVNAPSPDASGTPAITNDDATESPVDAPGHPHELVTPPITNVPPPPHSIFPPQTSSSPIDSDPLLSLPPQSGSTPSEPPSPANLDETVIRSSPLNVTDPIPPSKVDSTLSSPIDSAADCTISTANGGASS